MRSEPLRPLFEFWSQPVETEFWLVLLNTVLLLESISWSTEVGSARGGLMKVSALGMTKVEYLELPLLASTLFHNPANFQCHCCALVMRSSERLRGPTIRRAARAQGRRKSFKDKRSLVQESLASPSHDFYQCHRWRCRRNVIELSSRDRHQIGAQRNRSVEHTYPFKLLARCDSCPLALLTGAVTSFKASSSDCCNARPSRIHACNSPATLSSALHHQTQSSQPCQSPARH